jgi:FdhE protein
VLPDAATRFAATARRLTALAQDHPGQDGHPMNDWLRFMAHLASAQQQAIAFVANAADVDLPAIEQAIEAGMPPLSADGHRRQPVWRTGLSQILGAIEAGPLPQPARDVVVRLRAMEPAAIEALADDFIDDDVQIDDVGAVLYIAAALQVYWTVLAARLSADRLRLLPQRGLCPCCGSTPSAGLITAGGKTPGVRYLHCSLCSTAWNHVRAVCITCGGSRTTSLTGIENDPGVVKAETCDECKTYAKMIYQKQDMQADPYADDLASLALDILVAQAGWARHTANLLLLTG